MIDLEFGAVQDPNATLSWSLYWGEWLPEGDTLSAASWIISPAGPVVENESFNNTTHSLLVSGVVADVRYSVTSRIETTGGLKDDRTFVLVGRET